MLGVLPPLLSSGEVLSSADSIGKVVACPGPWEDLESGSSKYGTPCFYLVMSRNPWGHLPFLFPSSQVRRVSETGRCDTWQPANRLRVSDHLDSLPEDPYNRTTVLQAFSREATRTYTTQSKDTWMTCKGN